MLVIIAAGLAQAGMVTAPPPGTEEVGLLLCAGDGCNDRMFWISHDPDFSSLPIIVVDALLADNVAATQDDAAAQDFREALQRARLALVDGRRVIADNALNDAERALALWAGSPTNQEQFDLWYLRGAAAQEAGLARIAAAEFRRAAATAWNRSVSLPEGTEPWADPYYDQLQILLDEGTGAVVIEDSGATLTYFLDGVELGTAPARVNVFPGAHRLDATNSRQAHSWHQEIEVVAGRTTPARARMANDDDAQWAAFELIMSIDSLQLDPDVARLLDQWADRHGVRKLRLLRLDIDAWLDADEIDQAVGGGLPTFRVRSVVYDPALRRMTPLP